MEEADNVEEGISRPRRQSSKKAKKLELLASLRNSILSGKKNKYDVGELENVYEEVDEKEYSKKVLQRQDDDWIVDDDGSGYVEDGREIFDDDLDEESIRKSKGDKFNSRKRSRSSFDESYEGRKGSIKNLIVNMPAKKKKEAKIKLEDDDILGDIIGELDSSSTTTKSNIKRQPQSMSARDYVKSFESMKTFKKPLAQVNSGNKKILSQPQQFDVNSPKPTLPPSLPENVDTSLKIKEEPMEEVDHHIVQNAVEEEFESFDFEKIDIDLPETNVTTKSTEMKIGYTMENKDVELKSAVNDAIDELASDEWAKNGDNPTPEAVTVDKTKLPLVTNENNDEVFRFYCWDAHEELYTQPGTVFLFGKVAVDNGYTSCCVLVKNISRQIFLLPRERRINLQTGKEFGDPLTVTDVYEEFNSAVSPSYKIKEFRSRNVVKKYGFGRKDVPLESEYLEIRYSASFPALPSDLVGETFSAVFGTKSSFLEIFLLDRGMKGPCWIDVKGMELSINTVSWCKIEGICSNSSRVQVLKSGVVNEIPPLVMMVLNPLALFNSKTKQNEIMAVGCLINNNYFLDRPPPERYFTQHFCILSKPTNVPWPYDLKQEISKFKKTNIEKMESERALLNLLITRIFRIDPDIIIGHDLSGYGISLIVDKLSTHKIPNWSRLGRLKRSTIPHNKNKTVVERIALTGRLLCDIKLSAKELIRSRSYDLGALCQNVLHFPEDKRQEMTDDDFKIAYSSSSSLIAAVWYIMSDASYIIRILVELNALPLALQITNIAGNLMSRTLLGGRSERNEFLLLHAFHNRGYILPDKEYKKNSIKVDNDENEDIQKPGKKKPSYAGGLVLDPKVGFYDNDYILLMDFNSLYPSIIQEYNICFTTIPIASFNLDEDFTDDYHKYLPDNTVAPGVLPTEIRKLVESRREVKILLRNQNLSPELKLQYDIRQMALKLTANSMYGCLGFSLSRFYAKPLAALVTAKGREILLNTKRMVESYGYEVIYGDTDSLMISTKSRDTEQVYQIGRKIKAEVNKCYNQVELDIDGVFKNMLLLRKKKYAAVTVTKLPSGEIVYKKEMKGLDMVRRDWCQLSAETGKFVLDQILQDHSGDDRVESIHSYLENIRQDLENGKVPLSLLTVTKQLTKPPEEYNDSKGLPHVQVALRVNKTTSKRLKQGDTVSYVICEDGTKNPATQRAYHLDELKANENLKIDIEYYLSQQIHPVIARLCDPIEGTDAASIARCLGLDPAVYVRRTEAGVEEGNAVGVFGKTTEERFIECEKFTFTCKNGSCGKENVIDGPERKGVNGVKELVLEKCVNPECTLPPLSYLAYIQNKLQLDTRNQIHKYTEGWIRCEDPVCHYRTTGIPTKFDGAYPLCPKCENSVMRREISSLRLYNQLYYYSYMFDLSKLPLQVNKFDPDTYAAYRKIYDQANDIVKRNKYSMVDLSKLFSGIFPTKR